MSLGGLFCLRLSWLVGICLLQFRDLAIEPRQGHWAAWLTGPVQWRRAGVWDRIMDGLNAVHDAAVQMIDTSVIRVHQHGACIANNSGQHIGRSRGGLTSKIHVIVDANGLPVHLGLTGGQAHDNQLCSALLRQLPRHARWQIVGTTRTGSSRTTSYTIRQPLQLLVVCK